MSDVSPSPRPCTRWCKALPAALLSAFLLTISTQAQQKKGDRKIELGGAQGSVTALPASAKRFALIIGIDHYTDPQISPLRGAARDAAALAEALQLYAGFPANQITVLASDQPAARQPTRPNILHRLSTLKRLVPKDGLLLLSFSGHGMERAGKAFLLASDAQVNGDIDLLEQTALDVEFIHRQIASTGVGQVIVLLDACRNDPMGGRSDTSNALTRTYTRGFNFDRANEGVSAYATLYATGIGQRAYESSERRQGYFTWTLVEGLSGAAADERGRVTLHALVRYLEEQLPRRVAVDLGVEKSQRPLVSMGGYRAADLILAIAPTGSRDGRSSPEGTRPDSGVDPKAIELAFWEAVKETKDRDLLLEYLRRYPQGEFAVVARKWLEKPSVTSLPTAADPRPAVVSDEERVWSDTEAKGDPSAFEAYLKRYPNGRFTERAKLALSRLASSRKPDPSLAAAPKRSEPPPEVPHVSKRPDAPLPATISSPSEADLLLSNAIQAFNHRDYDTARRKAREAIASSPKLARGYYLLGLTARAQGLREEAIDILDKGLAAAPRDADLQYCKALLVFESGDAQQAESLVNQLLVADSTHALANVLKGDLAVVRQDTAAAATFYTEALERLPKQSPDYNFTQEKLTATRGCMSKNKVQVAVRRNARASCTAAALALKSSGTVEVVALFGVDSKIRFAFVRSGLPYGLNDEAILATQQIAFEPSRCDGVRAPAWRTVAIKFECR